VIFSYEGSPLRVGLVTCNKLPEPDPDEQPLLAALKGAGVDPHLIAWDDSRASPAELDCCILRSSWNYYEDPAAFLSWIERADRSTRLFNPASVIRWNLHKSYLRDLDSEGIPIVPTAWVTRGESASLARLIDHNGWKKVVIKPAVSASSYRTHCFSRDELTQGQEFLDGLSAERDLMVQQYLPSVEQLGERALVWIDGSFTHAVTKSPRFADGDEHVSEATHLSAEEREFGERAISAVHRTLLYARVDVIRDDAGMLRLSELELIEPSLFLAQAPHALDRFVRAILNSAESTF